MAIAERKTVRTRRGSARRARRSQSIVRLDLSTRGLGIMLATLAALWLVVRLWSLLVLVIISLMLAAAAMPFVDWMIERGLSRARSVLVVGLILAAVGGSVGLIVVPSVIDQARMLSDQLPEIKSDIAGTLRDHDQSALANEVERFRLADVMERDQVVSTSRRVLQAAVSTITVLVLTIYILIDARRIRRFFFFCVPDRYHEHIENLLPAMRTTVGGYVRGQLLTSAIISAYTFLVLFALGVPNAIALAVLAGIADVIPLVGAFIAVVPATIAALSVSTTTAAIVFGLLMLYQQIEDRILVPRVYGSTLRLPTVAVFLAVLAGAKLAGIVGAVLSLPAAAALRVIIVYFNSVRQGRIEPVAPEDELFAPDEEADNSRTTGELAVPTDSR